MKNDYRTKREKLFDYLYVNRKTIFFLLTILSILVFFISVIFKNEGGFLIVFTFPISIIILLLDLYYFKYLGRGFDGCVFWMLITIIAFVLGFFVSN